ncbi:MAG: hypothetical protein ACK48G_07420 [Chitinophagaceae bacterium]|jgi:hypothetical protein
MMKNSVRDGLIGVLVAMGLGDIIYSFTGATAVYGILYPAGHVLLNIAGFLSLSFIRTGERWASWLFLALVALHLMLDASVGAFNYFKLGLLLPAAFFIWHTLADRSSNK